VFQVSKEDSAARVYEQRSFGSSPGFPESPEICLGFEVRQGVKQIGKLFQIRVSIF
jgi:hypothetical protein